MSRVTFSFIFKLNLLVMSSFSLMGYAQIRDRRAEDAPRGKIVGQQSVARSTVYQNYVERAAGARRLSDRMYPDNYRSNALRANDAYYTRNQNNLYGSTYGSYAYPNTGYDASYSYGAAYGYPNMMNDYGYGTNGYSNQMLNPNYGAYSPMMDPYYSGSGYNYPAMPTYPGNPAYSGYQGYPVNNYLGNPYSTAYRSYNPGMYGPNTTFVNPPPAVNYSTGYPGYSQSYFRYR